MSNAFGFLRAFRRVSADEGDTEKNMKILRLPKVLDRVGKSKASVYRDEAAGRFPKRLALGANSVGWLESEIDAWIEARAAAREVA